MKLIIIKRAIIFPYRNIEHGELGGNGSVRKIQPKCRIKNYVMSKSEISDERNKNYSVLINHTYGSQQLEMEQTGWYAPRNLPDEAGGSIPPQAATQTKYEYS